MVCHMFQCWQSSSLRITRCRWAMSGGIQCFMLNVYRTEDRWFVICFNVGRVRV